MAHERDVPHQTDEWSAETMTPKNERPPIVCRMSRDSWGFAIFLGVLAIAFLFVPFAFRDLPHPRPEDRVIPWFLSGILFAMLGGISGWAILTLTRVYLILESQGVRWRYYGAEQFVRWDEVADYFYDVRKSPYPYRTLSKSVSLQRTATLVTKSGDRLCYTSFLHPATKNSTDNDANTVEFCAFVSEYATSAKVSEWEVLGTRSVDEWPRTFLYGKGGLQIAIPVVLMCAMFAGLGIAGMVSMSWEKTTLTAQYMGWGWALAPLVTLGVFTLAPIVGFGYFLVSIFRLWQKLRHDRFVVTREELHYESPTETLTVSWSEVVDYFRKARGGTGMGQYVLILAGRDERQIEFSDQLVDAYVFAHMVARYAGKPVEEAWRFNAQNKKQEPARRWQTEGGERVFSYRRGEASLMLWMPLGLSLCTVLVAFLENSLDADPERIWNILGVGIFAFVPWLYGFLVTRFASVEIDDFGITQKSLFGTKRLLWLAVADYYKGKKGAPEMTVVGRNGVKIHVWSLIENFGELKEEIQKRAPKPHTEWQDEAEL